MPHDIDIAQATKKGCENPYATENSITIIPKKHKKIEDKILQTKIDIVCLIDKNKCDNYQQMLSEPNILIRIIALYTLEHDGKIVDNENKKISNSKFVKMAKQYVTDKLDSSHRFWMEDILRDLSEEMLDEYKKADEELKNE